mmetsp:Transcript_40353/g.92645  ORF Transcript_40353/g.92645 Transcript_40353/m.92645 type:complete len:87 (-) Transcript_40353:416-676(-)
MALFPFISDDLGCLPSPLSAREGSGGVYSFLNLVTNCTGLALTDGPLNGEGGLFLKTCMRYSPPRITCSVVCLYFHHIPKVCSSIG